MNISRNIFMMCYFLSKRLRVTLRVGQNRILKIDPDFLWTLIINHIPVLKGGMIGILEPQNIWNYKTFSISYNKI